ncbi:MAG: glycoside hydrolase family 3 protein, partial [Bacteroidota bacterium]
MSTKGKTIEEKVEALLTQMTLEEKIGQMSQVRHFDDIKKGDVAKKFIGSVIHTDGPSPGEDAAAWQAKFRELQEEALSTRLGIPLLLGVDAVHGQNTFPGATIFPHNIGMGATNNAFLVHDAAAITAKEVLATGLNWTFSPCIAVPYNERWGRVYEAFSESTEITEQMARASVRGHQGNLADPNTIMATAKHYIGDGATDYGKEGGPTTLNRQEVLERLLPPYRAAVEEGVGAIMASFNTLHGVAMHAHKEMITDTLKGAMGFDGIVMTDWKGYSRFGKNDIVNAGVDMFMAVDGDLDLFQNGLKEAVESGEIKQERIDDAVRRILRQKFRLGLFDNPFPNERLISTIGSQKHRDVARQAVRESLVLLKHENEALPIAKNTSKIVVVGEHANNTGLQSGGWTVSWQGKAENYPGATTILQGIQEQAEGEVIYDADGTGGHEDADVAIIVVGETPYAEFFGDIKHDHSREEYGYTLNEQQQSYLSAYAGKGPKIVVVLISGRPLVVTDQIDQSDA